VEATFGTPVTEASNGRGVPVTKVVGKPGLPVRFETIGVGPGVTYATWDAATVTAVTLSGGNLVATNTGTTSVDQGAHVAAAGGKSSGKYYFEATFTTVMGSVGQGVDYGAGVGTPSSTYTGMGFSGGVTGGMVYKTGSVYMNGSNQGSFLLGTRVSGDVIGIAVDLDNRKLWFRVAPSGNWNASGTANPATNTGGFTLSAGTMVPFATFGGASGLANNVITANFGASAFTGAVPAGFTSGWPA
jgi:hypothetical protein